MRKLPSPTSSQEARPPAIVGEMFAEVASCAAAAFGAITSAAADGIGEAQAIRRRAHRARPVPCPVHHRRRDARQAAPASGAFCAARSPSGDPALIVDRALTVLLAKVEKEKLGASSMPRPATPIRPETDNAGGPVASHPARGQANDVAARRGPVRLRVGGGPEVHGAHVPRVPPRPAFRPQRARDGGQHRAALPPAQPIRGRPGVRLSPAVARLGGSGEGIDSHAAADAPGSLSGGGDHCPSGQREGHVRPAAGGAPLAAAGPDHHELLAAHLVDGGRRVAGRGQLRLPQQRAGAGVEGAERLVVDRRADEDAARWP